MTKTFKQKNNKNSGFTLVETLIAISIFTVSILSLMSVLANGISNTNFAKKKITAEYLAQEGIEEIRNMRDTYALYSTSAPVGWTAFSSSMLTNCSLPNGCYFNNVNLDFTNHSMPITTNVLLTACTPAPCPSLKNDLLSAKYDYALTSLDSGFIRTITATPIPGSTDEIKITSTVSWIEGSVTPPSISFSENLYNWIE